MLLTENHRPNTLTLPFRSKQPSKTFTPPEQPEITGGPLAPALSLSLSLCLYEVRGQGSVRSSRTCISWQVSNSTPGLCPVGGLGCTRVPFASCPPKKALYNIGVTFWQRFPGKRLQPRTRQQLVGCRFCRARKLAGALSVSLSLSLLAKGCGACRHAPWPEGAPPAARKGLSVRPLPGLRV